MSAPESRLQIAEGAPKPLQFDGGQFVLRSDARPAERHFRRWYQESGRGWIGRRVERLSRYTLKQPERIEVGNLGYRWGSCGKGDVLFFNWKVLQLPVKLVDYVIMHELIHLTERHHGRAFWAALERALPDWRARKEALANEAKDYLVFGLSS